MWAKIKAKHARQTGRKAQASPQFVGGQVTVEMTMAFICTMLLFCACVKIFFWFNRSMVLCQDDYEQTRITNTYAARQAGMDGSEGVIENYEVSTEPLNLF